MSMCNFITTAVTSIPSFLSRVMIVEGEVRYLRIWGRLAGSSFSRCAVRDICIASTLGLLTHFIEKLFTVFEVR